MLAAGIERWGEAGAAGQGLGPVQGRPGCEEGCGIALGGAWDSIRG